MFGSEPRAPLAARFAVPIQLPGVDDTGFCDASFWKSVGEDEPIALVKIAQTAVSWLEGRGDCHQNHDHQLAVTPTPNGQDQQHQHQHQPSEEFLATEIHMRKKLAVIRQYAEGVESNSLVRNTSHIRPEWVAPAFRFLFSPTVGETIPPLGQADWTKLVSEIAPGIYAFDLFSAEFCDALVQEVDSFEASGLPCRRPNTMNRLGLVVNDIGLEPLMTHLLEHLLSPMCAALYPHEMIASALDHHHSFCVQYKCNTGTRINDDDNDAGLDMHHDASEATLNVCLGKEFTGAGLRFCGHFGSSSHRVEKHVYQHVKGRAILHLGRHRHGADDIATGERINMIVWARNSAFRAAAAYGHVGMDGAPMEQETGSPDRLCLSKANDRDFEKQMKRIESKRRRTDES